jgi:hypothetical protein
MAVYAGKESLRHIAEQLLDRGYDDTGTIDE